jgi:hypothetical protein
MATSPNTNPPTPNPGVIEERVVAEIRARRERGVAKYGVGMERSDLTRRQWLQHAKEEALDLAIYLEKLIVEEDAKQPAKLEEEWLTKPEQT